MLVQRNNIIRTLIEKFPAHKIYMRERQVDRCLFAIIVYLTLFKEESSESFKSYSHLHIHRCTTIVIVTAPTRRYRHTT